jgi:hypothetical protein
MAVTVELDKKKKTLTITMPLESPRPSASGKTRLIASTRGVKSGAVSYMGKAVSVVANAFYYDEESVETTPKRKEPVGDDEVDAE